MRLTSRSSRPTDAAQYRGPPAGLVIDEGNILAVDETPEKLKPPTDANAQPWMSVNWLAGAMAIGGGGLVLVGWAFDITALKSVLPGWVAMMPNTAIAFVLSGIALMFARPSLPKLLSRLSQLCGWLVGLIGLLTLIEYACGSNTGFDQWLFRVPAGPAGILYPGRMAPDAAFCFTLLAAGMEMARRARRKTGMFVASAILGLLVTMVACFETLSFFRPHLRLFGWSGWTMMALPTAALFLALSAAIVWGAWRDTLSLRLTRFASHFWWMSGCVGALAIAFALSARSEAQVNRANELRYRSFLLADELRQSSDDLTHLVQTYAMSGKSVYKQRYQDILDIRNGRQPRPKDYRKISWDLMLSGGSAPLLQSRPAISLLELMRQAGFAENEFRKLAEATANSDELTRLEVTAMKLVESTGPNAGADQARARMILFDDHYHQAKAAIMKPIDEFFVMVDRRTLATVQTAENLATMFRYIFAAFGLGLMFMLWRTYLALGDILGGGVDEVRAHIAKIGGGDFSSIIKPKDIRKNSVLGWLSAMQAKLITTARDRQQAEEALHASEAGMAAAQRLAHLGSWELELANSNNIDANALRWSDEMFRIAGYEPGAVEVTNELFFRLVPVEDHKAIRQAVAAAVRERRSYSIIHRLVRTDGNLRVVHEMGQLFFDERTGQPLRILGTAHDITEKQRVAEELESSLSEFRALAEAMPQMVWITRPDGWCIYFSRQWMDYTGLNLEESLGHGWNKPFHPEDQQRSRDAWQDATTTTGTYSIECRLRRADGVYRWWLIRGVPQCDAGGNILKWFGTCTDIHELKLAEDLVRQSEERYRSLIDNARDAIFTVATDGTFSSLNPAVETISGVSRTDWIGRSFASMVHPQDLPLAVEMFQRVLKGETAPVHELRGHPSLSRPAIMEMTLTYQKDECGKIIGALGIGRDITERKQAEQQLEQAHTQLLAASRQAGIAEFATGVLHNVGNVLNSVNLASTFVVESLKKSKTANLSKVVALLREHETDLGAFLTSDPKGKQLPGYLAQLSEHLVGEQAGALKELGELQKDIEHIKSIITVQQDSAKKLREPEVINLAELVEDALKMNANGLARSGIHVTKEFEKVPPILTKKNQVLHILVNLVRNAGEACRTTNGQENRLTIRLNQEAGRARIAVADNGSGISPENLAKIFTHGFTTKKDGHGFGLHSATLAAKEMGGSLTVHSNGTGLGAAFTLELPIEPIGVAA